MGAAGRTPGLPSAEAARREEPEFEHVSETADGQARQQAGTQTGEHACTQKSTHTGEASERPHKNRAPRPSVVEAERQTLERPSTRDGRVPETSSAGAVQRQNLQTGRASAWPSKHQAERQRTEAAKRQSGPYQDRARLMAGLAESRERRAREGQHRRANKRESEH